MGRFFVTSTHLAFSTSGISIDHPHDSQTAMVIEIRRIAIMTRIDAADGTPGLRITVDDRRTFVFSGFCGLHASVNNRARERDTCASLIRMNECFLQRPAFSHEQSNQGEYHLGSSSTDVTGNEGTMSAQRLEPPTLPLGEVIISSCVCACTNGAARTIGKFTIASESCSFLPVKGYGRVITYKTLQRLKPELQKFGWRSADIIIPLELANEPVMRVTGMTVQEASSVLDELIGAIDRYSVRKHNPVPAE
jgi:hypothetical protein